jgi:hypothetical protein
MNACLNTAGFMKGDIFVYPKNSPLVKVGDALPPLKPNRVFRNDNLVVYVIK